jgi:hypothetical protein
VILSREFIRVLDWGIAAQGREGVFILFSDEQNSLRNEGLLKVVRPNVKPFR